MLEHRNMEEETTEGGSNQSFGKVFGVVFLIIGLLPLLHAAPPRFWALAFSTVFFLLAFLQPDILAPLNRLWTKIGLALHHVMTPLLMGLVFFIVVTPIGLLMRALGKRTLALTFTGQPSYWIVRTPPGPEAESFTRQF